MVFVTQADIFATKGMEYILVIGFLLVLVLFWRLLNRSPAGAAAVAAASARGLWNHWFKLKEGLFYHQGHVWAAPEEKNMVKIGLDDFAQRFLGKPRSFDMPSVGHRLVQGEKGGKVKIGTKSIDFLSPVTGEVQEVNPAVLRSPDLLNKDPYGDGWLMKVKVSSAKANLRNLLSGRLAKAWMEETVQKLQGRLSEEPGMVMQDGGVPVTGMVQHISPEDWDKIAREFLLSD
jgi:glycine cleavage system H lipoate-binding protein